MCRLMKSQLFIVGALACATPAQAQSGLDKGLIGALKGCKEWILNPVSWSQGFTPFVTAVGLGDQMGLVDRVEEVNLPPPTLRKANYYWRINSTPNAGYVLVVSDQLPMCHITGGGGVDLQPIVERVLASSDFNALWVKIDDIPNRDMASTRFGNRDDPSLVIQISRAKRPGQRLDRVQLIATATYKPAM